MPSTENNSINITKNFSVADWETFPVSYAISEFKTGELQVSWVNDGFFPTISRDTIINFNHTSD